LSLEYKMKISLPDRNIVNHLFQFKPHPFRLLLSLEWILLGMTTIGELPLEGIPYLDSLLGDLFPTPKIIPFSWLITILCLVGLALLGLRLPTGNLFGKWLYTLLQLILIWLATISGNWTAPLMIPYLIVLIRSCLIFQTTGRLITTGLVFISFLVFMFLSLHDIQSIQSEISKPKPVTLNQVRLTTYTLILSNVFFFGLILVFVLMLVNALVAERQIRQKLSLAHDQLRHYALKIEDQAILQERNRIAREIHDSLGHTLTAQNIQLENALLFYESSPEKTQPFLRQAKQLSVTALKEIRQSISTLRLDSWQEQNLETEIESLLADYCQRMDINPQYEISLSYSLSVEVKKAIYQIIKEALTNIYKHSQAKQISLKLRTDLGSLFLAIEDDGKGFNPGQNTTGFGLQGMRERTAALSGQFYLRSSLASGCEIQVIIPLIFL